MNLVLESLRYTKEKFENYTGYPSYEFKQQRVAEVEKVIEKVKEAMKDKK